MRRLAVLMASLFVAALAAYGCGDDDDNNPNPGPGNPQGRVRLRLTDAPADFDSIVIGIREISIRRGNDTTGWLRFTPAQQFVDVLTLRNGVFLDLGTFTVPAGNIGAMRMLLDSTSHVVVSGQRQPIMLTPGDTVGYEMTTDVNVAAGATVDVGIDFDALRSLRADGAGGWNIEPNFRLAPFNGTGSIAGTITPGDSLAGIYVLSGADTVASTFNASSGDFAVTLLNPGTYNVLVYGATNQRDTTITGVTVTAGQATNLGTIPMMPLGQQARAYRSRY